jgi:hypothetical protein
VIVSYFWAVVLTALLGAAPRIPLAPRFALGTLLIGATLAAVGLGLIVWAANLSRAR